MIFTQSGDTNYKEKQKKHSVKCICIVHRDKATSKENAKLRTTYTHIHIHIPHIPVDIGEIFHNNETVTKLFSFSFNIFECTSICLYRSCVRKRNRREQKKRNKRTKDGEKEEEKRSKN